MNNTIQSISSWGRKLSSFSTKLTTRIFNAGRAHYCPVCNSHIRKLFPYGDPPRNGALCPVCNSLERHRLDIIFLKNKTNLYDGNPKKILHVAPELFMELQFRKINTVEYVSADIKNPRAMLKVDITSMDIPDNSFHAIYCSHVLEHIEDDHKALKELLRVLKPGGWALLQVPINAPTTFEDPSITSPEERKKIFGQSDHVRRCGPDYINRMKSVGYITDCLRATDILEPEACEKMGVQKNRLIFHCIKPSPAESAL